MTDNSSISPFRLAAQFVCTGLLMYATYSRTMEHLTDNNVLVPKNSPAIQAAIKVGVTDKQLSDAFSQAAPYIAENEMKKIQEVCSNADARKVLEANRINLCKPLNGTGVEQLGMR